MAGEEARYVLEEDGGRSVSLHKVEEGEGEAGSGASVGGIPIATSRPLLLPPSPARSAGLCSVGSISAIAPPSRPRTDTARAVVKPEAPALPGDAEVLTGEAAGPENSVCVGLVPSVRLSSIASSGPLPPPGLPSRMVRSVGVRMAGCASTPRLVTKSVKGTWRLPCCHSNAFGKGDNVAEVGDAGPVAGEDGRGVGVDL